jgi:hypothetical protein
MENKYIKTRKDIEDSIKHKELNSHQINTAVQPPKYFGPIPTIDSGTKTFRNPKNIP